MATVAAAALLAAFGPTEGPTDPSEWELAPNQAVGSRRHLLMGKWKAKKMCPPTLDICKEEMKAKKEEKDAKKKARLEQEALEAAELEELSGKASGHGRSGGDIWKGACGGRGNGSRVY